VNGLCIYVVKLIFLDASKESIDKFISEDKSKNDENLFATLEAEVGIRLVVSFI
jgi:hypothetical protein